MNMAPHSTSRPTLEVRALGGAVHDVWRDATTLVSQHATLASLEFKERTKGAGIDVALLAFGAVVAQAAILALLATAALGLYQAGLTPVQAGLTVAMAAAFMAVVLMVWGGVRAQRRITGPSDTLLAVKESKEWLIGLTRMHQR